jgi:hypothetical protein
MNVSATPTKPDESGYDNVVRNQPGLPGFVSVADTFMWRLVAATEGL